MIDSKLVFISSRSCNIFGTIQDKSTDSMNAKSTNRMSRTLALIALIIALYNTYLEWLDKTGDSYLFYLSLIFIMLSVLVAEYSKKQNR